MGIGCMGSASKGVAFAAWGWGCDWMTDGALAEVVASVEARVASTTGVATGSEGTVGRYVELDMLSQEWRHFWTVEERVASFQTIACGEIV